jgi:hypothetical protein
MPYEPKFQSGADLEQFEKMEKVFLNSCGSLTDRINAFPKFASRQAIAKFLVRYEIFRRVLDVNGSIIECGVLHGAGLFTFAKLSAIFEPVNHTRRIIGFDTYEGFPSVNEKDTTTGISSHFKKGGLAGSTLEEMQTAVELFDANRSLSHIQKIDLVKGDLCQTGPEYLKKNPHLVVALLYLDLDIYEPTKVALETFVPRIPRGGIIAFDEMNTHSFPGETIAVDEVLGIKNLKLERSPLDPYISFCVVD